MAYPGLLWLFPVVVISIGFKVSDRMVVESYLYCKVSTVYNLII